MGRPYLDGTARFHLFYRRIPKSLDRLNWLPNTLLRLSVGFMFFSGAVAKLSDIRKFTAMFNSLGIPVATLAAPAVAGIELVGGIALMLGFATRPVSLVLAADMAGALATDVGPNLAQKYPRVWDLLSNLFYSSEWLLTGLLLWLVCVGPGYASVDALIGGHTAASASELKRRSTPGT